MKKIVFIIKFILLISLSQPLLAENNLPHLFLFLGGDEASFHKEKLVSQYVSGAQIIYSWKQLEPQKNVYDFSKIKKDLTFLNHIHKKLFIQIQDRSFEPTVYNVPDYLREENMYHGGVAMQYDVPGEGVPISTGWVARVWDPLVRERFQRLLKELSKEFDGQIDGINLPESSVDFDPKKLPEGFTSNAYFYGELENLSVLKKSFHKSLVVQFVNFFPGEWNNDHHYMSRLFHFVCEQGIGLGGPDVLPYHKIHMENSYAFFNKNKGNLIVSMAIQEPDYTYKNPETGKVYTFKDFYHFSRDYLGASYIFWNIEEPFYSQQLVPNLKGHFN